MLYPYICGGKEDVYGEEIVGYMFGAPFGMKDNKGFNAISGSEFMNIDSGDLLPFMYLPDGSMSPLFQATQVSHTSLTICPMRSEILPLCSPPIPPTRLYGLRCPKQE